MTNTKSERNRRSIKPLAILEDAAICLLVLPINKARLPKRSPFKKIRSEENIKINDNISKPLIFGEKINWKAN